ncbi:MAG: hypothetical protein IJ715_02490 [Bacilli bacterium]|nr:hypothetical protein [Bacilli bacterium]
MAIDISQLKDAKGSFQPLSYDEMARPIQNRTMGMLAMSNAYENAELESSNLGLSQDEYNTYLKPTMDKIRSASNSLTKYGLEGSGGINEFLRLRQDYARNITPVKKAQESRINNINMQNAIRAKATNPSEVVFKRNAQDIPLDEYIKNPNISLTESFDADKIRTSVAANLVPLKKMILDGDLPLSQLVDPNGNPLKGMYLKQVVTGLSDAQLTQMLVNQDFNSPAGRMVKSIVDNTLSSYGINAENGWNEDAITKATQAAYSVLPQAVGETSQSTVKDENYFANLQFQHQIAAQNNSAANTRMNNYLEGKGFMKDKDGNYTNIYGLSPEQMLSLSAGSKSSSSSKKSSLGNNEDSSSSDKFSLSANNAVIAFGNKDYSKSRINTYAKLAITLDGNGNPKPDSNIGVFFNGKGEVDSWENINKKTKGAMPKSRYDKVMKEFKTDGIKNYKQLHKLLTEQDALNILEFEYKNTPASEKQKVIYNNLKKANTKDQFNTYTINRKDGKTVAVATGNKLTLPSESPKYWVDPRYTVIGNDVYVSMITDSKNNKRQIIKYPQDNDMKQMIADANKRIMKRKEELAAGVKAGTITDREGAARAFLQYQADEKSLLAGQLVDYVSDFND